MDSMMNDPGDGAAPVDGMADGDAVTAGDATGGPAEGAAEDDPEVRTTPADIAQRKRVGQRIEQLRRQRGLSIVNLAELAGVSRGHLHHIVNGDVTMKFTTLAAVVKALGVSDLFEAQADTGLSEDDRLLVIWHNIPKECQRKALKWLALVYSGFDPGEID